MGLIQKYINLYSDNLITKTAFWQRYTSSQRFLGNISVERALSLVVA